MYAECQQLLHDDGGLINLIFTTYVTAHGTKVSPMDRSCPTTTWTVCESRSGGGPSESDEMDHKNAPKGVTV